MNLIFPGLVPELRGLVLHFVTGVTEDRCEELR